MKSSVLNIVSNWLGETA